MANILNCHAVLLQIWKQKEGEAEAMDCLN